MKGLSLIISLVTAVILLATAICAVVIFQEELTKLFARCKEYCTNMIESKNSEFSDFADV